MRNVTFLPSPLVLCKIFSQRMSEVRNIVKVATKLDDNAADATSKLKNSTEPNGIYKLELKFFVDDVICTASGTTYAPVTLLHWGDSKRLERVIIIKVDFVIFCKVRLLVLVSRVHFWRIESM